jgi:hypothetical protein
MQRFELIFLYQSHAHESYHKMISREVTCDTLGEVVNYIGTVFDISPMVTLGLKCSVYRHS